MKQSIIKAKCSNGSVTVFLSLILLIILSMIMTILEGARLSTAKVFAERALYTSMDSVLAEFYGPLLEEYHLLGLDTGYGKDSRQCNKIPIKLIDNMNYTFYPNTELNNQSSELYGVSVEDVYISDEVYLTGLEGELFINEAIEYMKYEELGDGAELLLNKMSLLSGPKKVSVLYEEKHKLEEELVDIDKGILKLMKLLDGVSTNKDGLRISKEGDLRTEGIFVKMLCNKDVSMEQVGINNESIFKALKNKYLNPTEIFDAIEDDLELIEINKEVLDQFKTDLSSNEAEIYIIKEALDDLEAITSKTENDNKRIAEYKEELLRLEEISNSLQIEINEYSNDIQNSFESIINNAGAFSIVLEKLEKITKEAIETVDSIIIAAIKAEPLINNYEDNLTAQKDEIDEEIYTGLDEELKVLKKYTLSDGAGYNFPLIKEVLEHNLAILTSAENSIAQGMRDLKSNRYIAAKEKFQSGSNTLKAYKTEGLRLDYSSLVISKESDMDALGVINSLLGEGLAGLVVDTSKLSKLEISESKLPSVIESMKEESDSAFDFKSLFSSIDIGGKNAGVGDLFASFSDMSSDSLSEAINEIAAHLLFQEYLQEHFYRFSMKEEELKARKPSALSYEQEYLLMGKLNDKDNLEAIILRIIFIRTILNFVSILRNKTKRSEARTIATSLVGFTGLPIIVSITQTILMIILAFAEALVDTSALLMGKEISILKKAVNLEYYDLLSINRVFIKTKAEDYTDKPGGMTLSYSDYLRIFLILKKKKEIAYRSMDLIQENIRIRYDDKYNMQNTLYGYSIKADFIIKPRFLSAEYFKSLITGSGELEKYQVVASYSY